MRKLFIIIFIAVFVMFDNSIGYTDTLPIWKHFAYVFQHAGFAHLIMNSVSFYLMWGVLRAYYSKWIILSVGYSSAVTMSFFTSYSLPVVGASGMIYAFLGMYGFHLLDDAVRFGAVERKAFFTFLFSVVVFLAISFFKTNQAGLLHLLCLLSGISASYIISPKK